MAYIERKATDWTRRAGAGCNASGGRRKAQTANPHFVGGSDWHKHLHQGVSTGCKKGQNSVGRLLGFS
jgi:hypothetical protein